MGLVAAQAVAGALQLAASGLARRGEKRMDLIGAITRRPPPPPAVSATRSMARRLPPLRVQKLRNGSYLASARLPNGAKIVAAIPAAALERWVTVGATGEYDCSEEIAGIFSSIAKGFSKVMHSDVVQVVASTALAVYPGIPPGVTRASMEISGDLVDKLNKGHPAAKAKVEQVKREAAAGNPTAKKAAVAIAKSQSARKIAGSAMGLLYRAQNGDQNAQSRVRRIEDAADRGDRKAIHARVAMQAVVDASRRVPPPPAIARERRQPPPPVVRRQPPPPVVRQQPPPPVVRQQPPPPPPARAMTRQPPPPALAVGPSAKVLHVKAMPNGKRRLVIEVGGPVVDWYKTQFGFYKGVRPESATFGLRDAYLAGLGT